MCGLLTCEFFYPRAKKADALFCWVLARIQKRQKKLGQTERQGFEVGSRHFQGEGLCFCLKIGESDREDNCPEKIKTAFRKSFKNAPANRLQAFTQKIQVQSILVESFLFTDGFRGPVGF